MCTLLVMRLRRLPKILHLGGQKRQRHVGTPHGNRVRGGDFSSVAGVLVDQVAVGVVLDDVS